MTTFLEKSFCERLSVCVCASSPVGFEGRMWDLIVLVLDNCLSIYFVIFWLSICKSHLEIKLSVDRVRHYSAHKLAIEEGRYRIIERNQCFCTRCNTNVENEYHFMLVCPLYRDIRNEILPHYYSVWPNQRKFETL